MHSAFRDSYRLGCSEGVPGINAAFYVIVLTLERVVANTVDGIGQMGQILCASIPAIMFSLVGILSISMKDTLIAGIVMIIVGCAILFLINPYGWPACALFLIVGILIIYNR